SCGRGSSPRDTAVARSGFNDAETGTVHVEINAHARWVCALDIASDTGKLLSAAEDSFVRIWQLQRNPESNCIEVRGRVRGGAGPRR
uniref:WD repeat-containing protein 54 beta-propeller domain-containing protein n=1 Tax=Callorhinchus milii TaxID=7868 RepID=A0A4W3GUX1_CALMI